MLANPFLIATLFALICFFVYRSNGEILYLTNINSIESFNSTSGEVKVLFKTNKNAFFPLDVDSKNDCIYWAHILGKHEIKSMSTDGSKQTSLFSYGIGIVEGISVDWSSNNIYWTDTLLKVIEVSTTSGKYRKVLFDLGEDSNPRSILVDPKYGYLFWTDWGKYPKIERSSLTGTGRKVILSNEYFSLKSKSPMDLAIDYASNRIYWIDYDEKYIGSMSFSGFSKKRLYEESIKNLWLISLSYDENKKTGYVTDWRNNRLYRLSPFSSIGTLELLYGNNDTHTQIMRQVRLYNKNIPTVTSPCSLTCSHLCLKRSRYRYECECPTGYKKSGSTRCLPRAKEFEIFFADSTISLVNRLVKYKDQAGFTIDPLQLPRGETFNIPVALDYSTDEDNIYWIDEGKNNIYKVKSSGLDFKLVIQNTPAKAIKIHEFNNVIYYFDSSRKAIMLSSLDGNYKKTLKSSNLKSVDDIALHDDMGYIFYTDIGNQKIVRMDIYGENIYLFNNTVEATGLAVDKTENRLYWCDRKNKTIQSSDLNFQNIRTIVSGNMTFSDPPNNPSFNRVIKKPFGISLLNNSIYWSDSSYGEIYSTNKRFGGKVKFGAAGLGNLRDLHVVDDGKNDGFEFLYYFSYDPKPCWTSLYRCSGKKSFPDPQKCKDGYVQTKFTSYCNLCNRTLCSCNDWTSCAHKSFLRRHCPYSHPYFHFKVRECTRVVRYGFCPYNAQFQCPSGLKCHSDSDCSIFTKCCNTKCGQRCVPHVMKRDHPCKKDNGKCSHFCFGKQNSYTCECPDNMQLDSDKKTCKAHCEINNGGCSHGCDPTKAMSESCFCRLNMTLMNKKNCVSRACNSNPCSNICTPDEVSYTCSCPKTMKLDTDNTTCRDRACLSQDCNENGICDDVSGGGFRCTCSQKYFIGRTCSHDLRKQLTIVKMKMISQSRELLTKEKVRKVIATYINKYCSLNSSKCNTPLEQSRRRSLGNFTITPDDIYIKDFKIDSNNVLTFSFAVKDRSSSDEENVMNRGIISEVLNAYKEELQKDLDTESMELTYPVEENPKSSGTSSRIIIAAAVGVALLIIIVFVVYCCCRRGCQVKGGEKQNKEAHGKTLSTRRIVKNSDVDSRYVTNPHVYNPDAIYQEISSLPTQNNPYQVNPSNQEKNTSSNQCVDNLQNSRPFDHASAPHYNQLMGTYDNYESAQQSYEHPVDSMRMENTYSEISM